MILSKQEQDEFFNNYVPLLYYAAMYEGLLPEGANFIDFGHSSLDIKVQSRNALFTDPAILRYYRKDNGNNLPPGGKLFLGNVKNGILSEFVVLKQEKKYAILQNSNNEKFYHVCNITDPFSVLLSYIPNYITTAILNFNGKIICDGLVTSEMNIGPNIEKNLLEEYKACKINKEILTFL